MSILNIPYIQQVSSENLGPIFHETSIAYIYALLKPFTDSLEAATTFSEIDMFIESGCEIRNILYSSFLYSCADICEAMNIDIITEEKGNIVNLADVIVSIKKSIIECLIEEICESEFDYTDIILPWNIQDVISGDKILSKLFKISKKERLLPVTVTPNNNCQHTWTMKPCPESHSKIDLSLQTTSINAKEKSSYDLGETFVVSMNWTYGLLLFFNHNFTKCDFDITMFGVPLLISLISDDIYDMILNDDPTEYIVEISEETYFFKTFDCMQGFIAGAEWTGVDHHRNCNMLGTTLSSDL